LVVYGHSGSGKTTLLVNKLHQLYERHLTSRCVAGMTFDQLVADAFDQLGPFYSAEHTRKTSSSSAFELTADYAGIKGVLRSNSAAEAGEVKRLVLPPQLTPQTLGRFMGAAHCCWVLEDFHKISNTEKHRLAQTMKVFMDMADEFPDLRIVALGAVDTAREVVEYDAEMRNRVSEIHVPLMSSAELREMIACGEHLLNVDISRPVVGGIVKYSNGLAAVCHQQAALGDRTPCRSGCSQLTPDTLGIPAVQPRPVRRAWFRRRATPGSLVISGPSRHLARSAETCETTYMARPAVDIDQLTPEERLDLIERLWDSLSDDDVPLTSAQREELDHRLDALDREGPVGIPWEQVYEELGTSK
jgi:putative addiction module component (TIGR02574 family)